MENISHCLKEFIVLRFLRFFPILKIQYGSRPPVKVIFPHNIFASDEAGWGCIATPICYTELDNNFE